VNEIIIKEAKEINAICEKYGFGSVMEWASAFYRYRLKKQGLPPEHAYVPVILSLCDENHGGIKVGKETRKMYDEMVENIMSGEK
jgi:hypothetical protein